jgi:hypothetical protein
MVPRIGLLALVLDENRQLPIVVRRMKNMEKREWWVDV